MISKIENHLINAYPDGTILVIFDDMREDQCEKLNNCAITCGLELTDEKIDMEANYQIAKRSKNAFVYGFDSINYDDSDDTLIILVRDDSLSDNTHILMYISDNEDGTEIIYYPVEKRVYAIA